MNAPNIRIWKGTYNYVVAINDDCYEMDANADLPNGICMYLGSIDEISTCSSPMTRNEKVPIGIIRQIMSLWINELASIS